MPIDYLAVLNRISPPPSGEDELVLRVGTVTAMNTNGTADVTLSGITVAGVSRLSGIPIFVGAVVQILSYRGSLLIIGRSESINIGTLYSENINNVTTTSASYAAAASNNVGGVFRYPASGLGVRIDWSGELYASGGTAGQVMSIEIREGAVVGSGTVLLAPSDDYAVRSYDTARQQFGTFYRWAGGSANATYNIRLQYKSTSGGVTANFERRRCIVEPILV